MSVPVSVAFLLRKPNIGANHISGIGKLVRLNLDVQEEKNRKDGKRKWGYDTTRMIHIALLVKKSPCVEERKGVSSEGKKNQANCECTRSGVLELESLDIVVMKHTKNSGVHMRVTWMKLMRKLQKAYTMEVVRWVGR